MEGPVVGDKRSSRGSEDDLENLVPDAAITKAPAATGSSATSASKSARMSSGGSVSKQPLGAAGSLNGGETDAGVPAVAAAPTSVGKSPGMKSPNSKKSGLNFKLKLTPSAAAGCGDVSLPAAQSMKKTQIYDPDAKVAAPPIVPPPAPPSAAAAAVTIAATMAASSSVSATATSMRASRKPKPQVKSSGYGKLDPRHPKPKMGSSTSIDEGTTAKRGRVAVSSSRYGQSSSTASSGAASAASASAAAAVAAVAAAAVVATPSRSTSRSRGASKSPPRSSVRAGGLGKVSLSAAKLSAAKWGAGGRTTPKGGGLGLGFGGLDGAAGGDYGARVGARAEALLKPTTDNIDRLLNIRVKGKKYEYKERADAATQLVNQFRTAVKDVREQQRQFINDAAGIEEQLLRACESANATLAASAAEADELRVSCQLATREKDGLAAELDGAKASRGILQAANDAAKADLFDKTRALDTATARVAELDGQVLEAVRVAEELALQKENEAAAANAKAAEAEAALASQVSALTADFDVRSAALTADVAKWMSQAEASGGEAAAHKAAHEAEAAAAAAARERSGELKKVAESLGAERDAEAKAKEILEIHLASAKEQLAAKAGELTIALGSLGEIQRSCAEREQQLRTDAAASEAKAAASAAEVQGLKDEVSRARHDVEIAGQELSSLKDTVARLEAELAAARASGDAAAAEAKQLGEALAVERELRGRAEAREEEERRERTASNAQLMAQQHANEAKLDGLRREARADGEKTEAAMAALRAELEGSRDAARQLEDQKSSLESEAKSLRTLLEDQKKNGAELVEMAKRTGELDSLRQRMAEQAERSSGTLAGAQERIKELEAEVHAGEALRRKMHNVIQELRGNVRVFARVRPFLPGDGDRYNQQPLGSSSDSDSGDGSDACVCPSPVVKCAGGIESTKLVVDKPVSKAGGSGGGDADRQDSGSSSYAASASGTAESHAFSFDKCFPPSIGQEEVFQEVSEFVTSALDGYQVCLFSYGQTGSGKTHTMQGSGDGAMRGIIPRAIEQVGKYKASLETQGWTYTMNVTFVEIYNETIRDLLRADTSTTKLGAKDPQLDIRTAKDGAIFVADATKMAVDPTDLACISNIMEIAARHRAVSATDMNAQSSRSHSIFTLHLTGVNQGTRSTITGALNLVDLAGSERLSRSGATGDRLRETQAINKSLACLSDVFMAISKKQAHIPYRNSKLTHLLSPALSGDGKTLMLVNLSPTEESYFESLCSLRFASTVNKCELGKPKKNTGTVGSSAAGTSKKVKK